MVRRGGGPLGGLGGGESQRRGVEALASFFAGAGLQLPAGPYAASEALPGWASASGMLISRAPSPVR